MAANRRQRIPSDADVLFIEARSTGTVHITVRYKPWHNSGPARLLASGVGAFFTMMTTPTLTRCGKRTFPSDPEGRRHRFTDQFNDDSLCAACYQTLAEEDQGRAFEHEQGADE